MSGDSSSDERYPSKRDRKQILLLLNWIAEENEEVGILFNQHYYSDRRLFYSHTRSYFQNQEELFDYGISWNEKLNCLVKEKGAENVLNEWLSKKRNLLRPRTVHPVTPTKVPEDIKSQLSAPSELNHGWKRDYPRNGWCHYVLEGLVYTFF